MGKQIEIEKEKNELTLKYNQYENDKQALDRNREREHAQIEHEKQLLVQQKTAIDSEKEKLRKDIETFKFQKQQQNLQNLAMSQSSNFYNGLNGLNGLNLFHQ